jgi:aspartate aminotransferase
MNGVSKAYAMTGWRIGYAGAPAELVKAMTKLQSQSTGNPSSVGQAAALAALTGPQGFIAERAATFQRRRDVVAEWIDGIPGLSCHVPEGAFYVFPSCEGVLGRSTPDGKRLATSEDLVMHLLEAHDLAAVHGEAYGVPGFFRLSFATSMDQLEEGCRRLERACAALVP